MHTVQLSAFQPLGAWHQSGSYNSSVLHHGLRQLNTSAAPGTSQENVMAVPPAWIQEILLTEVQLVGGCFGSWHHNAWKVCAIETPAANLMITVPLLIMVWENALPSPLAHMHVESCVAEARSWVGSWDGDGVWYIWSLSRAPASAPHETAELESCVLTCKPHHSGSLVPWKMQILVKIVDCRFLFFFFPPKHLQYVPKLMVTFCEFLTTWDQNHCIDFFGVVVVVILSGNIVSIFENCS